MKHVSELLSKTPSSITKTKRGQSALTPEAADYIGKVFERLIVICPAWKVALDRDPGAWAQDYKLELAEALKIAGVITGEQIKSGLAEIRKRGKPFLPAPGEFANSCTGDSGLPGLSHNSAAYRDYFADRKPGQRQICQKMTAEAKESGLERISRLRHAIG